VAHRRFLPAQTRCNYVEGTRGVWLSDSNVCPLQMAPGYLMDLAVRMRRRCVRKANGFRMLPEVYPDDLRLLSRLPPVVPRLSLRLFSCILRIGFASHGWGAPREKPRVQDHCVG
jgi:hypothetical protein